MSRNEFLQVYVDETIVYVALAKNCVIFVRSRHLFLYFALTKNCIKKIIHNWVFLRIMLGARYEPVGTRFSLILEAR